MSIRRRFLACLWATLMASLLLASSACAPPAGDKAADRRIAADAVVQTPVVRGRAEECLVCHAGIEGLDPGHRPEQIGCASCHGGNIGTRDARLAHVGLIRVPGNLADAPLTCAQAACHASVLPRVTGSIMTTMAGVVAVDRRVFGDPASRVDTVPHVATLGASAADTHLRQLCASCHLGQPKTAWGPATDASRGGGCTACHLTYDSLAARQLAAYVATAPASRTGIPGRHPAISIAVDNGKCFGCHSRSARISTNYEGWTELQSAPPESTLDADARAPRPRYRRLADGRVFARATADVHQERGLACIDCHVPSEVMGTGKVTTRSREQIQIRCTDCHATRLASIASDHADAESQTLLTLRGWRPAEGERLAVAASGAVLTNVVVDANQRVQLRRKLTGAWAPVRAPASACLRNAGHARLTCNTCHTAWAPRCATCHTTVDPSADGYDHLAQADVRGAWVESSGPFEAAPPTLGVVVDAKDRAHPRGVVDTFIPGMIMTLDRPSAPGAAPDRVLRRLYARTFSHTIRREVRSCTSCHADPVALGYGRGVLRLEMRGGAGRWVFTPGDSALADGLPAGAWTGFLRTRLRDVSTRDDARPLLAEEQRRILTVGACLTCHDGASAVMQRALKDFDATLARRGPRCVVPRWDE